MSAADPLPHAVLAVAERLESLTHSTSRVSDLVAMPTNAIEEQDAIRTLLAVCGVLDGLTDVVDGMARRYGL